MSSGGSIETVGENIEFAVGTAGTEVTVYFTGGAAGDKTSADDTATEKYTDNYGAVKAYCLRPNEAVQIISINDITFTDSISIAADTSITEKLDTPVIYKMKIKTTTDNTNIKLRVRGR
jgi:hypothetical protein